jgi:hypothetical protein
MYARFHSILICWSFTLRRGILLSLELGIPFLSLIGYDILILNGSQ